MATGNFYRRGGGRGRSSYPPGQGSSTGRASSFHDTYIKLHVKNIPKTWDKHKLTYIFKTVGTPVSVYLNETPHTLFNWGFVEYEDYWQAEAAINGLNDNVLADNIKVAFAREKSIEDCDSLEGDEISFMQENENDDYILEIADTETLEFMEKALIQRMTAYYEKNPRYSNCSLCGAKGTLACSSCGMNYCSETCQQSHWPTHYTDCILPLNQNNDYIKEPNKKFESTEFEHNSKGNGFKPFSKERREAGDDSFKKRASYNKYESNQNSKENERFGQRHNANTGSKSMFEQRESKFLSEKRNTDSGKYNSRKEGPGFSNDSKTVAGKYESGYNNESTRGSRVQEYSKPSNNLSTGNAFLSKQEEFVNIFKKTESDVKDVEISKPIFKKTELDVKDAEIPKPIVKNSEPDVKDVEIPKSIGEKQKSPSVDRLQSGQIDKVIYVLPSEDQFYVRVERYEDELDGLLIALHTFKSQSYTPVLKGLCMSKYEDIWCRCEVINLNPLQVFYIDYGNTEPVSCTDLFTVPPELAATPPYAVKIKLAEGTPKEYLCENGLEGKAIKSINKINDVWVVQVEGVNYTETNKPPVVASSSVDVTEPAVSNDKISEKPESSSVDRLQCGQIDKVIYVLPSEDQFYVRLERYEDELDGLLIALHTFKSQPYTPVLKGLCMSKYEDIWCRCEVINLNPLQVLYIDYGNTEPVRCTDLFTVPPELAATPPYAVRIKLADGTAKEYSCESGLEGKVIKPINKINDVWVVQVEGVNYTETNKPPAIASSSVDVTEPAVSNDKIAITPESHVKDQEIPNPIDEKHASSSVERLQSGQIDKVNYVLPSEDMFYVRLERYEAELENLLLALHTFKTQSYTPVLKGVCMAKYEDVWCRCEVINLNPLQVLYIDFGNTEPVRCTDLFTVPPEIAATPPYAVKIKLAEGTPKEYLCETGLDGRSIKPISKINDVWEVQVEGVNYTETNKPPAVASSSVDVTEPAVSNDKIAITPESHVKDQEIPNLIDEKHASSSVERLQSGQIDKVNYVLPSEDMFYVRLERYEAELENLLLALHTFKTQSYTPVLKGVCMAKYEDVWCRCEVINLNPLQVLYIDFGNTEPVRCTDLFTVPPGIAATPPYAVKIKLAEGTPKEYLCETGLDGRSIKPISKINDVWEVQVEGVNYIETNKPPAVASSSVDVTEPAVSNDKIVEKQESSSLGRLQCGQIDKVVSVLPSEDKFYVRIERYEDKVDGLLIALHTFKTQSYTPVLNGVCMAKYEGLWCRCEVINLNPLQVLYIDYGNTEPVSCTDLFTVPPELAATPPYAVKIKLADGTPKEYLCESGLEGKAIKPITKMDDFWVVEVEFNPCN